MFERLYLKRLPAKHFVKSKCSESDSGRVPLAAAGAVSISNKLEDRHSFQRGIVSYRPIQILHAAGLGVSESRTRPCAVDGQRQKPRVSGDGCLEGG